MRLLCELTVAVCPQESGHLQHLGQVHCTVREHSGSNGTYRSTQWGTNPACFSVWTPRRRCRFTLCPSGQHIWGFACSRWLLHSSHSAFPSDCLQITDEKHSRLSLKPAGVPAPSAEHLGSDSFHIQLIKTPKNLKFSSRKQRDKTGSHHEPWAHVWTQPVGGGRQCTAWWRPQSVPASSAGPHTLLWPDGLHWASCSKPAPACNGKTPRLETGCERKPLELPDPVRWWGGSTSSCFMSKLECQQGSVMFKDKTLVCLY